MYIRNININIKLHTRASSSSLSLRFFAKISFARCNFSSFAWSDDAPLFEVVSISAVLFSTLSDVVDEFACFGR